MSVEVNLMGMFQKIISINKMHARLIGNAIAAVYAL